MLFTFISYGILLWTVSFWYLWLVSKTVKSQVVTGVTKTLQMSNAICDFWVFNKLSQNMTCDILKKITQYSHFLHENTRKHVVF